MPTTPQENQAAKDVTAWLRARVSADKQMRAALRERTAEPPEPVRESPDAIDVLGRQHGQVRYLLRELQALPGDTAGGSAEQVSARKSIVDMITVRLSEHQVIEQKHFWPLVRKTLPDGGQYARQALQQEQAVKEALAALGQADPGSRDFNERVEQLVTQFRRHIAFEDLVFLKVREAVPQADRERLGKKLLSGAGTAPSRPRKRAQKRTGQPVGQDENKPEGEAR